MATELKAADLLVMEAAWKYDQGTVTDQDMAMAKLKATEMLAFVADEAIQIHGGMGLMDDLPLERIWRDARVERIWEGTSEIQRHIISARCCGRWGDDATVLKPLLLAPAAALHRRVRRRAGGRRGQAVAEDGLCRRHLAGASDQGRGRRRQGLSLRRRTARRARCRLRRRQPLPHARHRSASLRRAAPAARSAMPPASSKRAATMPTASGCSASWSRLPATCRSSGRTATA